MFFFSHQFSSRLRNGTHATQLPLLPSSTILGVTAQAAVLSTSTSLRAFLPAWMWAMRRMCGTSRPLGCCAVFPIDRRKSVNPPCMISTICSLSQRRESVRTLRSREGWLCSKIAENENFAEFIEATLLYPVTWVIFVFYTVLSWQFQRNNCKCAFTRVSCVVYAGIMRKIIWITFFQDRCNLSIFVWFLCTFRIIKTAGKSSCFIFIVPFLIVWSFMFWDSCTVWVSWCQKRENDWKRLFDAHKTLVRNTNWFSYSLV